MNFFPPQLSDYIESHTQPESQLLKDLSRETNLKHLKYNMLSGHLQGTFLKLITGLIQPKRILEIGTYTGYSALCFLENLPEDGVLHTIEHDLELEYYIDKYLKKHPKAQQVKIHWGDAIEVLTKMDESFDLVFIDAHKEDYPKYYDLVFPLLKINGLIIADNVLWSGKVIDPEVEDRDTISIRDFNSKVLKDQRVENIIMPLRDGLNIVRKISS